MRVKQLMFLVFFATAAHFSFGQEKTSEKIAETPAFKRAPMYSALFIVRSDLRTMELDPKEDEIFDVKSIDAKYVKFVTFLNSREGKKMYGEKGSNGVIIVQLADHYELSKENFIKRRESN